MLSVRRLQGCSYPIKNDSRLIVVINALPGYCKQCMVVHGPDDNTLITANDKMFSGPSVR